VRAQAWFQLGQVRLGYELWRQFNGFPPMLTPLE
jgi:adhesin transport system membrane fusion protein